MPVIEGGPSSATDNPVRRLPRFEISDGLKKNVHSSIKTAVTILGTIATMTQDVPYMGVVSKILTEVLKVEDELETLDAIWKSVMAAARQIKDVIDEVHRQCETTIDAERCAPLPPVLKEPFDNLEKCILMTLETLDACMASRQGGRYEKFKFRLGKIVNRGELVKRVNKCREDLSRALTLFNIKLQIDQSRMIHAMAPILDELRQKSGPPPPLTHNSRQAHVAHPTTFTLSSLPPAPEICHGREGEIKHVLDIILHHEPARVAILGPGGIGKTTVSLAVLHSPFIKDRYGDQRYFVSCEAIHSADGIVQRLLREFHVEQDGNGTVSPEDRLIFYLESMPGAVLCLDNMETPWDADLQATESLLRRITALRNLVLLITKRGTERPSRISWTQPFLPPIQPLPLEAAIATWDEICGFHDDYALELMHDVDYLPLAIGLLAHHAVSETSQRLLQRWQWEKIGLLHMHGSGDRLSSVHVSVSTSLSNPRLREPGSGALEFFSILCTLPQGLPNDRVQGIVEAFSDDLPDILASITLLKQLSLATLSSDGYLKVLSPVRHCVRKHMPLSNTSLARLYGVYHGLLEYESTNYKREKEYVIQHVQPELGNISEVLRIRLNYMLDHDVLEVVYHFVHLARTVGYYDTALLKQAIDRAHSAAYKEDPAIAAALRVAYGLSLYDTFMTDAALDAFELSLDQYRKLKHLDGQADCLIAMSDVYQRQGSSTDAERYAEGALSLYSEIKSMMGMASARERLGRLYAQSGRSDKAQDVFHAALSMRRENNDVLGMANIEQSIGELYLRQHQLPEAKQALSTALERYRYIGDARGEAIALRTLGSLLTADGSFEEAGRMLELSLELFLDLKDRAGEAHSLQAQGTLYHLVGRLEDAEHALKQSLSLNLATRDQHGEAKTLNRLGQVYLSQRKEHDAATAFTNALQVSSKISYSIGEGHAYLHLGLLYKSHSEFGRAEACLRRALLCFDRANHSWKLRDVRIELEALKNTYPDPPESDTASQSAVFCDILDSMLVAVELERHYARDNATDHPRDDRGGSLDERIQAVIARSHVPIEAQVETGPALAWEEVSIHSSSTHSDPETWSLTRTSSRASSPGRLSRSSSRASERDSDG
ncbi:unnamed protein product [Peniophora sp. CBMAI 1063]|nr:unnamed protein product [Peniophora sp. CBMAI 1063]